MKLHIFFDQATARVAKHRWAGPKLCSSRSIYSVMVWILLLCVATAWKWTMKQLLSRSPSGLRTRASTPTKRLMRNGWFGKLLVIINRSNKHHAPGDTRNFQQCLNWTNERCFFSQSELLISSITEFKFFNSAEIMRFLRLWHVQKWNKATDAGGVTGRLQAHNVSRDSSVWWYEWGKWKKKTTIVKPLQPVPSQGIVEQAKKKNMAN